MDHSEPLVFHSHDEAKAYSIKTGLGFTFAIDADGRRIYVFRGTPSQQRGQIQHQAPVQFNNQTMPSPSPVRSHSKEQHPSILGTKVHHSNYGFGLIIRASKDIISIEFDKVGIKEFNTIDFIRDLEQENHQKSVAAIRNGRAITETHIRLSRSQSIARKAAKCPCGYQADLGDGISCATCNVLACPKCLYCKCRINEERIAADGQGGFQSLASVTRYIEPEEW